MSDEIVEQVPSYLMRSHVDFIAPFSTLETI